MFLFGKKKAPETASSLRLPKHPHPLRGWTNFGMYEVHGVNPRTGRSNKKKVEALDEVGARNAAVAAGLTEPFTILEIQRPMATESQIDYGRELGVKITERESSVDASALICMVKDGEAPRNRITADQWAAACSAGVCVSALACQRFYRSVMRRR